MGLEILLENASKSLDTLTHLKKIALKVGNYEFAAKCREKELEVYPISSVEKEANARIEYLEKVFKEKLDLTFKDREMYYKLDKFLELERTNEIDNQEKINEIIDMAKIIKSRL